MLNYININAFYMIGNNYFTIKKGLYMKLI